MKRSFSFILVLLFLFCSFGLFAAAQIEETPGVKEPVEFTVGIFGNETHKAVVRSVLDKVEEEFPYISVEIITIPWGEYIQKLSVQKISGDAPDIIWAADVHLKTFMDNGLLVDISSIRDESDTAYDFKDYLPDTLNYVSKDGKLFGIPFSTAPKLIMYNDDLFKAAGLESPYALWQKGEWTYEAFANAVVKITDKSKGIYGYASIFPSDFLMSAIDIIWGYGAEAFNAQNTKFTLNTPEGRKALQLVWDLYNKYDALPTPDQSIGFESGKVAMFKGSTSNFNKMGNVGFKWSIAPLPEGPGDGAIQIGYAAYAVLNDRHSEEDLMKVLKGLTNKAACEAFSKFFIPSRASVINSDTLASQFPLPKEIFSSVVLGSIEKGRVMEVPNNYAQMNVLIQAAIERMILKDTSVEDTLNAIEKDIQEFFN